jgi:glycosyltransferase involved in cell wall biosynthesis
VTPAPLSVAINGWFAGRAVGSGLYTDQLLSSLRTAARPGERFELLAPGSDGRGRDRGGRGAVHKLAWEQLHFPRAAAAFDLAHVPYWAPSLRPACPTIVTIHDLIPLLLPEYRRRPSVRAYTSLVVRASKRAAAILADSEHTAGDIRRHLDVEPARIHVVPLGVEPRFRPQPAEAVAALALRLDLPDRYGLYLGGFDARKNLITLLAAWREVHRATGLPLLIGGKPPALGDALHPHPAELARQAGLSEAAFRLLGHVPDTDLPALYAGAAVFAFASRYEGFGLTPLEAMACGTPVVVADASSLPEVVGEAGLRVAPDDVAGWSEAIRRVIEDDAQETRLVADGLARAATFSWERTARLTRRIYDRVANQG